MMAGGCARAVALLGALILLSSPAAAQTIVPAETPFALGADHGGNTADTQVIEYQLRRDGEIVQTADSSRWQDGLVRFVDPGLPPGVSVVYTLAAVDTSGFVGVSNALTVVTAAPPEPAPEPVPEPTPKPCKGQGKRRCP